MHDTAVRKEIGELEELLAEVEALPEGDAREGALAAISGLLRIYGEALRRIVAVLSPELLTSLSEDELIAQLLLLHDLAPADLEERIAQALEEVRPYMGSHGGGIELVEVLDGVARVRLQGTCSGCAASTVTLKLAVEEAVLRAAPELRAVEAIEEDGEISHGLPAAGLLPMFDPTGPSPQARWQTVDGLDQLQENRPLRLLIEGSALIVASLDGQLYAYSDHCPACRAPLQRPELIDGTLRCDECDRRYDLRRAGVGVDGGLLQLNPVPLKAENGQVRVAIEAVPA